LDPAHLERIRGVAAWSVVDGTYFADLLPLPMTEESLAVVWSSVSAFLSIFPSSAFDIRPALAAACR
jgi:hypothetical protein